LGAGHHHAGSDPARALCVAVSSSPRALRR
jgi:hypothetical protein